MVAATNTTQTPILSIIPSTFTAPNYSLPACCSSSCPPSSYSFHFFSLGVEGRFLVPRNSPLRYLLRFLLRPAPDLFLAPLRWRSYRFQLPDSPFWVGFLAPPPRTLPAHAPLLMFLLLLIVFPVSLDHSLPLLLPLWFPRVPLLLVRMVPPPLILSLP